MDVDDNPKPIQLVSVKDVAEGVFFDRRFTQFSSVIEGCDLEEPIQVDIDRSVLVTMKKFLEDHDYDPSQFQVVKPLTSSDIKAHLDGKSYSLFKDYYGNKNIDRIKPLLEASYYLNFNILKDALLCIISCDFYVGPTENDLDSFKDKHGLTELKPDEELAIMKEFSPVFEKLNEKFRIQLEEEQIQQ